MKTHYDKKYYEWQSPLSAFSAKIEVDFFRPFVRSSDKVIDYGCGGGFLLSEIRCGEKIGIEINKHARDAAIKRGLKVVQKTDDVPANWADIVISNHVLEHTERPVDELKKLRGKLKLGGKMVFMVPHELKWKYYPGDRNQHLYTWSEMSLGNLFTKAGFKVLSVQTIKYQFPPIFYQEIHRLFGRAAFDILCRIYSRAAKYIYKVWVYQIRIVCQK